MDRRLIRKRGDSIRKSGLTALYAFIVALVLFFGVREAQAPPSYDALAYGFITHNNDVRQSYHTEVARIDDEVRSEAIAVVLAERSRQEALLIAEAKRKEAEAVAEAKRKQAVAIAELKRKQASQPTPSRSSAPKVSATAYEATWYTAFCSTGCIGVTASGYDVSNTVYYDGYRILAADGSIPLYTIMRVTLADGTSFNGIVLDRGGAIGKNRLDILTASRDEALTLGRQKVSVEMIRRGSD